MKHHPLACTLAALAALAPLTALAALATLPPAQAAEGTSSTAAELVAFADQGYVADDPDAPKARAELLSGLVQDGAGLTPDELARLKAATAGAWLDAGDPAKAVTLAGEAAAVVRDDAVGLAWVAAALASESTAAAGAVPLTEPAGLTPRARARLATGRAQRRLAGRIAPEVANEAIVLIDQALTLLAGLEAAERVPVYILRVTAMEAGGQEAKAIGAYLASKRADPAALEVEAASITASARLVGQPAPALAGKRLDPEGGRFDLAALKGRWVLIDFFASWCKPCVEVAPAVARLVAAHPDIACVGVTLDTKETLPDLPKFLLDHGVIWPVIGDGLGWDTEQDDTWRVDAIPSLILVAPDGTVAATDLLADGIEGIEARLTAAKTPAAAP